MESAMTTPRRKARKEEKLRAKQLRKDRLIQTRVDRRLQKVLLDHARKQRISVSNLVRNILEDAFGLGEPGTGPAVDPEVLEKVEPPPLDHVYAWNPVILGKDAECARCGNEIGQGSQGFIGLSEDAEAPRAWLCEECGEDL